MALPIGAAAAANATTAVIVHLMLFLYSYGRSTSGMMVNRASKPLRLERGIIDNGLERRDAGCDSWRDTSCRSSAGTVLIVSSECLWREWPES
jgi:hypothetical protein